MISARQADESTTDKREAILSAALELFSERGYHGTAVPLVAEKANVGAGTLYRYFESKEALVNALYRHWKMEFGKALIESFPTETMGPRQQFSELARRLWQFGEKHRKALMFLEMHHHADYLDEESRLLEATILGRIVDFVASEPTRQALKPLPPRTLIAIVLGGFLGVIKAVQTGEVEPGPQTFAAAETCLWEAVRA